MVSETVFVVVLYGSSQETTSLTAVGSHPSRRSGEDKVQLGDTVGLCGHAQVGRERAETHFFMLLANAVSEKSNRARGRCDCDG